MAGLGTAAPQCDNQACEVSLPVRPGAAIIAEAIRRVDAAGIDLADLSLRYPTLDDVFLAVTGEQTAIAEEESASIRQRRSHSDNPMGLTNSIDIKRQNKSPRRPAMWVIADAATMTRRNLYRYIRIPSLVAYSLVQPVMFVLLFALTFGGALQVPGASYVDYLLPGTFILALTFGSAQTGVALAEDLTGGMIDRFRSLPMARSAPLVGRTTAEAVRNLMAVTLMIGVGTLIGFRFHTGTLAALTAVVLALATGLALSWVSALIGLSVRNAETAQVASLLPVIALIFTSSTFVPVATMPRWWQPFAEANPVTNVVDAMRALSLGGPVARPVLQALAWIAGILVVFVPLAVRQYRRTTYR